jgi:citrate lyase subunit beta / citryl-CoA lyase
VKPLRSLLNVPGNRPEMLRKAPGYGADALILDLEDAVPDGRKPEARELVAGTLADWAGADDAPVTYVRVNGLDTGLLEADLEAVVRPGLEGIQLPKAHDATTVRRVDAELARLERERGLPPDAIEILVSLESARGVLFAWDVLTAARRVGSVMVGTAQDADLQGDVGYLTTESGDETLYIRSHVILAARAAGITNPIDGVYADHRDAAGLETQARRARELGYRGKKLIHPAQIEVVHRVFTPTERELDGHRRVLEAFDAAVAEGRATAAVDGRMIDVAMAETARRVLGRAQPYATRRDPDTRGGAAR